MADVALFTMQEGRLKVLLLQRANEPAIGKWALPGGILKPDRDKSIVDTAKRVLQDKTRVTAAHLEEVCTFSGATRDPRGWSVTCLYYALLPADEIDAV